MVEGANAQTAGRTQAIRKMGQRSQKTLVFLATRPGPQDWKLEVMVIITMLMMMTANIYIRLNRTARHCFEHFRYSNSFALHSNLIR